MTEASDDAELRRTWRDLVGRRLPEAAATRPDWPVRLDHCFARILLDNSCGRPWREVVAPPAWATMPTERLAHAAALGEAVLADRADLALLDRRSLGFRGKGVRRSGVRLPAPETLRDGDLVLRRWAQDDDASFAALNADPAVMRFSSDCRTMAESVAEARAFDRRFAADGFGPFAVTLDGEGFLGVFGAMRIMHAMPFSGGDRPGATIAMAWRLARRGWGRGIASRAARLALGDLFGRCRLGAVVAFTAACDARSRRLMGRLGMAGPEDFAHPALPPGHPLRPHVLHRLSAAHFRAGADDVAETGSVSP